MVIAMLLWSFIALQYLDGLGASIKTINWGSNPAGVKSLKFESCRERESTLDVTDFFVFISRSFATSNASGCTEGAVTAQMCLHSFRTGCASLARPVTAT